MVWMRQQYLGLFVAMTFLEECLVSNMEKGSGAIVDYTQVMYTRTVYSFYRLAYADFILKEIIHSPSSVNLLYDIGCKLESHWKVRTCIIYVLYEIHLYAIHVSLFSAQSTAIY